MTNSTLAHLRIAFIIEDDISFAKFMERILLTHQWNNIVSCTIQDAIDKIEKREKIDIILMDIGLPDPNNLPKLLEKLSEYRKEIGKVIPIIIISGWKVNMLEMVSLALGAVGFISKDTLVKEPDSFVTMLERSYELSQRGEVHG